MKDVKEIHDIPEIELHLDKIFTLVLYEVGDKLQIYEYQLSSLFYFNLEIHGDETLIEGRDKLSNLITQCDIGYLQFSLIDKSIEKAIESWCYRPLVPEENKDY